MKILQMGEVSSSNLGDGVIADCLANMYKNIEPKAVLSTCDITIRPKSAFYSSDSRKKIQPLARIHHSIKKRSKIYTEIYIHIRAFKQIKKYRKYYSDLLHGVDIVLIGGGQLVADNGMDFPVKLFAFYLEATAKKVPFAFISVGVGSKWRFFSRLMFRKIAQSPLLLAVAVRDVQSKLNYISILGNKIAPNDISIVPDSAWNCPDTYGFDFVDKSFRGLGIGVISPEVVSRHSPDNYLAKDNSMIFWKKLIIDSVDAGYDISIFTNGDPIDQQFAEEVFNGLPDVYKINVNLVPKPMSPLELVKLIESFSLVVAARLHANIIAWSMKIPAIGLVWDNKVKAFYDEIGHSQLACNVDKIEELSILLKNLASTAKSNEDNLAELKLEIKRILRKVNAFKD